jgi:hypothetical protein
MFVSSAQDNLAKVAIAANRGTMPWFWDRSLAADFALAVDTQLGLPNNGDSLAPAFGVSRRLRRRIRLGG